MSDVLFVHEYRHAEGHVIGNGSNCWCKPEIIKIKGQPIIVRHRSRALEQGESK